MKTILKPFGQAESPEARAVRHLVATPGFAQSIERIEYVDHLGGVVRIKSGAMIAPRRAVAERYTLTDAGAAMHDTILAGLVG